jgi:hypothetical protein
MYGGTARDVTKRRGLESALVLFALGDGIVAPHARDRAVARPSLVPEELLAEGDLLGRQWIVSGHVRRLLLKPERKPDVQLRGLDGGGRQQHHERN